MVAKKTEKLKNNKSLVKDKKTLIRTKEKNNIKRAVSKASSGLSAVEKAKSKVKGAFEKMVKAAKSAGAGQKTAPTKADKKNLLKPKKKEEMLQASSKVKIKAAGSAPKKGAISDKDSQNRVPVKYENKKLAAKVGTESPKSIAQQHVPATKKASAKEKNRCREPGCEQESLLSGYCRLHYIKNWKRIKKKEAILSVGQLDVYVEELIAKYPDKYLDAIENDLASEKEWSKVISDMELSTAEEDFTAEEDDPALPEAAGRRGGAFDDENDDIY